MNVILIVALSLLAIGTIFFLSVKKPRKSIDRGGPPWAPLLKDFKQRTPLIQSIQELEEYLISINEKVKQYETDYSFLVEFNGQIRKIRQRLKRID